MDPTAADTWYTGLTVPGNHICNLILSSTSAFCTSGRPAKIKALARTLGAGRYSAPAYSQQVYEYVYKNIDTEFRYGLSKGAFGTLLDQSGTPFDQAMLLVELLREGNVPSVQYLAGTITLNAAQFSAWTGITSAAVACRLLADGGIPAQINGTTNAACSYSGNVSSVTMSHIWVSANTFVYDPSYKQYTVKAGLSIATVTGCSNSTCANAVRNAAIPTGATYQGTDPSGSRYIRNVQVAALAGVMGGTSTSYAQTAENYIRTNNLTSQVDDVVGGRRINVAIAAPVAGAALPHQGSSVQRTWTTEIPDQYRARVGILFDNISSGAAPFWLFANEIDGYWLTVTGEVISGNASSNRRRSELHLSVPRNLSESTGQPLYEEGYFAPTSLAESDFTGSVGNSALRVYIDHPYYAADDSGGALGTYMDDSSIGTLALLGTSGSNAFMTAVRIVGSFGATGPGRVRETARQVAGFKAELNFPRRCFFGTTPLEINCPEPLPSAGTVAASFAEQGTAALRLVDGVNKTLTRVHHHFGIMNTAWGSILVDMRSGLSIASTLASAGDRRSAIASATAMLSVTESSAQQQLAGSWDTGSSIGRFAQANQNGHTFLNVLSAQSTAVFGTVTGGGASCSGGVVLNYTCVEKNLFKTYLATTTPTTFGVILAKDGNVGNYTPPGGTGTQLLADTGVLAYSDNYSRTAHLTKYGMKGGAGATVQAPDAVKSILLTDPQKKKEEIFKVDQFAGHLALTPKPPLVTGTGDFPSALPLDIYFDASSVQPTRTDIASQIVSGIGLFVPYPRWEKDVIGGWSHRYEITATPTGNAAQAFGGDSALDASAAIAALQVLRVLNTTALTTDAASFRTRMTSVFVANWLLGQLSMNSMVVTLPPKTTTFLRLPSGVFNAPPGSAERFSVTGTPVPTFLNYGFNYAGVQGTYTSGFGETITFTPRDYTLLTTPTRYAPLLRADVWSFPDGMKVNFQYAEAPVSTLGCSPNPCSPDLATTDKWFRVSGVTNSLGRSLTFTLPSAPMAQDQSVTVTSDSGQSATLESKYTGEMRITDAGSGVTRLAAPTPAFAFAFPALAFRVPATINALYLPSDTGTPHATFQYDADLRIASTTDKLSRVTQYFPASVSSESMARGEVLNPLQASSVTYFDDGGRPVQSIDPLGRSKWLEYDSAGRLTKEIHTEGDQVIYGYDVRHNRVSETRRAKAGSGLADLVTLNEYMEGATVTTCVNIITCNRIYRVTDAAGNQTSHGWNATSGLLESITGSAITIAGQPETPHQSFGYTPYAANGGATVQLLTSKVDRIRQLPNVQTVTTSYSYRPLAEKLVLDTVMADVGGLNLTTVYGFDAVGNVASINGPRTDVSDVTSYNFDSMRRLTRVVAPLNSIKRYTYDLDGRLTSSRKAVVPSPTDSNPSNPRPTDLVPAHWQTEANDYWSDGSLRTVTDPEGFTTVREYDAAGRLEYLRQQVTSSNNRVTRFVYDLAGQKTQEYRGWNTADQIRYGQWSYTGNGKLDAADDPISVAAGQLSTAQGSRTDMVYDGHDRLWRAVFPHPTTGSPNSSCDQNLPACTPNDFEQYGYDNNGNQNSKRNRSGITITMHHNAFNHEDQRIVPDNPAVAGNYARTLDIGYDLLGRVLTLSAEGQTITHVWDKAGRLDVVTDVYNSNSYVLDHSYDPAGNRTGMVWPGGGSLTYQYDALNRLTDVIDNNGPITLAHYGYDQLSRRDLVTFGNGAASDPGYYSDDALQTLGLSGGGRSAQFTYARNRVNQITGVTVTAATSATWSETTFVQRPTVTASTPYVPDKLNRYGSIGGTSVSYDANGNLTSDGVYTFTYDEENRLRTANGAGSSVTYSYDPLGRRRSKVVTGTFAGTTVFLSDGAEEIEERDGSNAVLRRYAYGSGMDDRVAMLDATLCGSRCYYQTNHQGSTVALSRQDGALITAYGYDAYGRSNAVVTGNPFRFTGRRFDSETGLYYYRARYYSTNIGRFLQTDPIGTRDDLNLYAYVYNDPMNAVDPAGTQAWWVDDNSLFQKTAAQQLEDVTVPILKEGKKQIQETAHNVSEGAKNRTTVSVKAGLTAGIGGEMKVEADRQTLQDGSVQPSVKVQQNATIQAQASATIDFRIIGPKDIGPMKAGLQARVIGVGIEVNLGSNGAVQSKISVGPQFGVRLSGPQALPVVPSASGNLERWSPLK